MITDLDKRLDVASLKDSFVFANTPSFLYKKFRSEASVQNLAENCSSNELVASFDELAKQKRRDLDGVVELYAIISALSLQDSPEAKRFFETLDKTGIPWGDELRLLYKAGLRQQKIYVQPQKFRSPSLTDTSSETPTTIVIVPSEPASSMALH
jgi:hypothetical protein